MTEEIFFIAVNANSHKELKDFENRIKCDYEIVVVEPTRENKRFGMFGKFYKIFHVYRNTGGSRQ